MRKTIWIARDGPYEVSGGGLYNLSPRKQAWSEAYLYWHGADTVVVCSEIMHRILPPADRLKPGEGPKRIKITLGEG